MNRGIKLTPQALEYLEELGATTKRAVTNGDLSKALERGLMFAVISEQQRQREEFAKLPTDLDLPLALEREAFDDWIDYADPNY